MSLANNMPGGGRISRTKSGRLFGSTSWPRWRSQYFIVFFSIFILHYVRIDIDIGENDFKFKTLTLIENKPYYI